jgi:hypothetical protein
MIARGAMTLALTLPAGTPLAGAARLLLERGDLLRAPVPDEPEAVA